MFELTLRTPLIEHLNIHYCYNHRYTEWELEVCLPELTVSFSQNLVISSTSNLNEVRLQILFGFCMSTHKILEF